MEEIKLVIFDMGNTLLDFHTDNKSDEEKDEIGLQRLEIFLQEKFDVRIDWRELEKAFMVPWYSDFYIRERDLVELNVRDYLNNALKKYGVILSEIQCLEAMKCFYSTYKEHVIVNSNGEALLKKLKSSGINIGVISNCIVQDDIYKEIFDYVGISGYIDQYVFSYSNNCRKPSLKLYKKMVSNFDIRPEEVLMIGDNLKADIEPAQKLGFRTIWYNPKRKINDLELNIEKEINDFKEVFDMFKE